MPPLHATDTAERLPLLDVLRGFALIGIFMMNIDSFNRPTLMNFLGIADGLTPVGWWWSWFIQYFVTSKFWPIFAILFGISFALMLEGGKGRSFLPSCLRRIAGLLLLGIAQVLLLWSGDILVNYALAALGLLAILYVRPSRLALLLIILAVLWAATGMKWAGDEWRPIGFLLAAALFLQCGQRYHVLGVKLSLFSMVMLLAAAATAIALYLATCAGLEMPFAVPVLQLLLPCYLAAAIAAAIWHDAEGRSWRAGVALYVVAVILTFAPRAIPVVQQHLNPAPAGTQQSEQRRALVERAAADIAKYNAREAQINTQGSFEEGMALRIEQAWAYERSMPNIFSIGMFLIGMWLVQCGAVHAPSRHLPLFRKLACYALPLGVGLSLAAGLFGHTRNSMLLYDPFLIASLLRNLAALPASLGYIGLVVLLAHGRWAHWLAALAPLGRMALSNYLMQSLLSSLVFFPHGLGLYGIPVGAQILYVAAVLALQLRFSHWWLKRYRYGPAEYPLRALTRWCWPAMRHRSASCGS